MAAASTASAMRLRCIVEPVTVVGCQRPSKGAQ
jgi:hypothetical protein